MRKPKYKPLCCVLVVPTKVVKWMGEKEVGRSRETDGGRGRGMARGHQLCLPADPNTLGFFATEGLKVHPTRSPTATQTGTRQQKTIKRKQSS